MVVILLILPTALRNSSRVKWPETEHFLTRPEVATQSGIGDSEFVPTECSTAAEKADFGNTLLHFLDSGGLRELFTKKFCARLSITFGNIAHYNREGFYYTCETTIGLVLCRNSYAGLVTGTRSSPSAMSSVPSSESCGRGTILAALNSGLRKNCVLRR